MSRQNRFLIWATVFGLIFKIGFFVMAESMAPEFKHEPDSPWYIEFAQMMAEFGIFARPGMDGEPYYGIFRTPGYPLYLSILRFKLQIPWEGVMFSQLLLTLASAWLVYLSAIKFGRQLPHSARPGFVQEWLANLAYVIVLFDPPSAIFSLQILGEALFTLLIAGFLYAMLTYLENKTWPPILIAGLLLCAATFVRPISYYLGAAVAIFIFIVMITVNWKKAVVHTLIFTLAAYAGIGAWTLRNHQKTGKILFSSSAKNNLHGFGLVGSYERNNDPHSQGLPKWAYYPNVTSRCFLSLMTRPVSLKYFGSRPLTVAGKIFAYPWIAFWLLGFIYGVMKMDLRNSQHMFIAMCYWYFICASIGGVMWFVGPRFRMPIMPFIALFAAYGWAQLSASWIAKRSKFSK